MKVTGFLSTFVTSGIPFAYAVNINFYKDPLGCSQFGTQCGNAKPGVFCVAPAHVAYGGVIFSGNTAVSGTLYGFQNNNRCGFVEESNLGQNFCQGGDHPTITCASYTLRNSKARLVRKDPEYMEPTSVFFKDDATTYHINTTSVDKVDAFWAIIEANGEVAGLNYMVQHFDRIEQSSADA